MTTHNPCAVTHTSSHILASTQALRTEIIPDRTTWKIICVLGARLAHHTAHELVGEQKLNFFLCIVILNYFLNKTKYDSKISETLKVKVGPAIGNLFSHSISG